MQTWGQQCTGRCKPLLPRPRRSEEHTSELQSLRHLVCRLLLEIKNFLAQALSHFESPAMITDTINNERQAAELAARLREGHPFPFRCVVYPLYHVPVTTYLMLPFYYLFGPSLALVRLWPVLGGFLTLLFTYLFARLAVGAAPALLTVLLLVIHPFFFTDTPTTDIYTLSLHDALPI